VRRVLPIVVLPAISARKTKRAKDAKAAVVRISFGVNRITVVP